MARLAAESEFHELEMMYCVEDHCLESVHCDVGSIENEVFVEEELHRHPVPAPAEAPRLHH